MAISLLGRTLIARPKPNVLPSIFPRSKLLSSSSSPSPRLVGAGVRFRPLVAVTELSLSPRLVAGPRGFSTRATTSSLNDPSPNWNNRPPKETILLEGCDFEHWLIVVEKPDEGKTRDEIINDYIKTAASVIGSEEEARQKIYSVSTRYYFAFGVIVSEEQSYKFKDLPGVRWVLPDSYLDVRNKDFGGEPFINGEAVPYDPKYHEEWVRNNAKAKANQRIRNDRPRKFDRSRNFERRENVHNRDFQSPPGNRGVPGPNMVGGPPAAPNMQAPLPKAGGIPPNANTRNTAPNMGGVPPHANAPNYGGVPHNANVQSSAPNYGINPPNANIQNNAPNYGSITPNPNMQNSLPNYGGFPPRDAGYSNNVNTGNTVPNYGAMPPRDAAPNAGYSNPNVSSVPNGEYSNSMPNAGNTGNRDFQYRDVPNNGRIPPYQIRGAPVPGPRDYQNSYTPNKNSGDMASGNAYQVRDIPGRDYQ